MERAGLMQEITDLEAQYGHIELRIAREKFRLFAFRWRTMSKVNKMKKFDRDSYDFMRASLEIQEMVKIDFDSRISKATDMLKEQLQACEADKFTMRSEIMDLSF